MVTPANPELQQALDAMEEVDIATLMNAIGTEELPALIQALDDVLGHSTPGDVGAALAWYFGMFQVLCQQQSCEAETTYKRLITFEDRMAIFEKIARKVYETGMAAAKDAPLGKRQM